jgi:HlyD family secretion protein
MTTLKERKQRKRRLVWLLMAAVLGLVVVFGAASYFLGSKDTAILVSVEEVDRATIVQTVSAIGRIQPEYQVKISSEASGEIIYLGVRDGDTVRAGQLLVRIQPDILQTQVEQFAASAQASKLIIDANKAEVDRTEAELRRVTELYKKDFASREELDRATAAFQSATSRYLSSKSDYVRSQGALKQTQASASRTTILSPMDGVVTSLSVQRGEKVVGTAQMQGTEILRISNLDVMNAWVDVDENDVALISIGDTVRVRVDALRDRVYNGIVYEIGNSARVSAQGTQEEVVNFQVRIRLLDRDAQMRPGMSCNVDIETETRRNVLAVPIQSVTVPQESDKKTDVQQGPLLERRGTRRDSTAAQRNIVWVTDGRTVRAVPVETGISDQGKIEILNGLKEGDTVVVGPYQAISKLLTPGAAIKIESAEARKERFRSMRQQ